MVDKKPPAVDRAVALDIPELDDGLLKLLLPNIQSMLQHMKLPHGSDKLIQATAIYILKAIMIYSTQLSSPAMRHLNVRVCENDTVDKRDKSSSSPPSPSPRTVRNVIGITCLLPFIHELGKFRYQVLVDEMRRGGDDLDNSSEEHRRLKQRRQRRQVLILHVVLRATSILIPSIQLYHYLSYILNPRGTRIKTPSFALNVNDLSYEYKDSKDGRIVRKVNLLYAYRRVWYKELMLLLSILPVDVWRNFPHSMKLWYRHMLAQIKALVPDKLRRWAMGKGLYSNPKIYIDNFAEHCCSICFLRPVVIPYKTSCGHLCCYTCLRIEVINSNFNYKCLVCGEKVLSSQPLLEG